MVELSSSWWSDPIVTAKEMKLARERGLPPAEMVWAVCQMNNVCKRCPRTQAGRDGNQYLKACYAMAEESCVVVFAMQAREAEGKEE